MNIEHISVSRYGVWNECQQKYKFKYHLKVESDIPEQPYFLYGKVIHKILEEYTLAQGKQTISHVEHQVLDGKIILEDDASIIPRKLLPPSYLKKIPGHLKSFMNLSNRIGFTGECEWEFKRDLDFPNNKMIYGFIDRLIKKNDHIFILDYKTTQKGPYRRTKRDITTDLQLQSYAWVAREIFKVPAANIRAALFYLEGDELIGATFSENTLDSVAERLLGVYDTIVAADPDKARGSVGKHCERCPYYKICPFYSLTG